MVLVSTSILCAVVRLVRSSCLLDQLVHFLLRTTTRTELLLQRCNHISDQARAISRTLILVSLSQLAPPTSVSLKE